jgi:hypothetical protein
VQGSQKHGLYIRDITFTVKNPPEFEGFFYWLRNPDDTTDQY